MSQIATADETVHSTTKNGGDRSSNSTFVGLQKSVATKYSS